MVKGRIRSFEGRRDVASRVVARWRGAGGYEEGWIRRFRGAVGWPDVVLRILRFEGLQSLKLCLGKV